MAIIPNIDEFLKGKITEPKRIEFYPSYNPDEIIRSICAFANDIDNVGGGYIVIGVEEENGCPKMPVR